MWRDCDPKKALYPTKWEVVFCKGMTDKETVTKFDNKIDAIKKFLCVYEELKNIEFSNIRLYACDKEGYMNCILHEVIKLK